MKPKSTIRIERYCDFQTPLATRFERLATLPEQAQNLNEEIIAFVVKYSSVLCNNAHASRLRDIPLLGNMGKMNEGNLIKIGLNSAVMEEVFSLACLLDLHTTSAIFKEIAFVQPATLETQETAEKVVGVDFGSGSGILTVAIALAAIRRKLQTLVIGIEKIESLAKKTQSITSQLSPYLSGHGVEIQLRKADICADETYKEIQDLSLPLRFWVTETFNRSIPTPIIRAGECIWPEYFDHNLRQEAKQIGDPFAEVIEKSAKHFPSFLSELQSNQISGFPNFMNGNFTANGVTSMLSINGERRRLEDAGKDFARFENIFPQGRFPSSPHRKFLRLR